MTEREKDVITVGSIQPPLVTDGARVYFTEQPKDANGVVAQVSVAGGATARVPTPFPNMAVNGISASGSDLLVYTWTADEILNASVGSSGVGRVATTRG